MAINKCPGEVPRQVSRLKRLIGLKFICSGTLLSDISYLFIYRGINLFLVENGLRLYLWRGDSPIEGYRLAANYCEHCGPRYGNGLNGPSVNRLEEIARFTLAIEAHEEAGSKSSYGKS